MEQQRLSPLSDSQRALLQEATNRYYKSLSEAASAYLAGRGLREGTVFNARLGLVDDPLPGHEAFRGWLAIPYFANGHTVSMRFRCLREHDCKSRGHGKYMSLPDEPTRLYQATPVRRIGAHGHVAEGELDALVLVQCGLSAVGLPGATAWQPRHTEMLSGCGRLHTWGDPDKAGRELNDTVCKQIRQAQPARLTIGDVTETYLTAGADAIHELAA